MKWPTLIIWSLACGLIGCQGQGVGVDPFGPTRIPPPPTGSASRPVSNADPYYSRVSSTAPPLVPVSQTASTTFTPAANADERYASLPSHWNPAGTTSASSNATRLQPIASLISETRPVGSESRLASVGPEAWNQVATADFQEVINIDQNARTATSVGTRSRTDLASLPVQPTNAEFRQNPVSRTSGSAAPSSRYGYAKDYSWLKGQLEYSASQRQWKLRYIPIDGETDDYGGSVILPERANLEDYRDGEFVTVKGYLTTRDADARDYAANYKVNELSRQN